ncbi:MAG: hypothetical protein EOP51_14640 [Sphingobacteriales bacterium]|nr:MAG: hypothetical protein EOP51_14640 [Sphingobacteriales bacterium]
MSKKHLFILLPIAILTFLMGNLQNFPGPASWDGFAMGCNVALVYVLVIFLFLLPVPLVAFIVELVDIYKKRRSKIATWVYVGLGIPLFAALSEAGCMLTVEMSRSRAIRKAQPLIEYVAYYRQAHGVYPDSVNTEKYPTGSIRLHGYTYSRLKEAYSISFSRPAIFFADVTVYYADTSNVDFATRRGMPPTGYPHWYRYFN